MKFLIAGFGSIGRRHFRNLLALGERDILFLRSGRSTLPNDELSGFPVEISLDAALAHRPDAVIIATPTALHLETAIPAARQGCTLFLEKPVSHSLERIDELNEALQIGGGSAFVGFQYRFHPGLQRIAQLLKDGAVGRPVSVHAHWGEYLPGWHPWEDYRQGYSARRDLGGGVVRSLCHPLDYLRWLLGEITDVHAFTARLGDLEIDVEDTADILLRFENGVSGSLHLDYLQRPPAHRLEIVGTHGTLQWDNADGSVRLWSVSESRWLAYLPPANFDRNCLFLDMLRHFVSVVKHETLPLCTLNDGIRVDQLINQIAPLAL